MRQFLIFVLLLRSCPFQAAVAGRSHSCNVYSLCLGPGRSSRVQPLIASYSTQFTKDLFMLLKSGLNGTYQCKSSRSLKILGCDFWKCAGSTSKTLFSCMTQINDCSYRTICFIISSSMNYITRILALFSLKGKEVLSFVPCASGLSPHDNFKLHNIHYSF